jgi:hypothetical protein
VDRVEGLKMKIANRKPVLTVEQLRALSEFGKLKVQQQKFVLLVAAGATPSEAVRGAYNCTSRRSGERFLYDLMNRRSMQPILNRLYGLKADDKTEFLKRVDKLLQRGTSVTSAEVNALVLYAVSNNLLPLNYSPAAELAKLGKV